MKFLLHHLLREGAARRPDKEAIVAGRQRLSYAEAARRSEGLARGLRDAGLERGDRVGIFLGSCAEHALAIFGISEAGGVFVPINHLLLPDQIGHIVRDCRIRMLVTGTSELPRLVAQADVLEGIERLLVVGSGRTAIETSDPRILDFDELCRTPPRGDREERGIGKDLAAILYTSGSTGRPKGVMVSHAQLMAGCAIVSDYLEISDEDRMLCLLPFSFDAGLNQLITAVDRGGTIVLATFRFAKDVVETLRGERITGLLGIPTLWSLLVHRRSTLEQHRYPHLRYIANTGGSLPRHVLDALRKALPGTRIYLMYGLTEAFRSTYLSPAELDRRPTSIGKAVPGTEILVIDGNGRLCGPGEEGELVHRGPTVAMGYWGLPERTAEVFRPHPLLAKELGAEERVCYSGDLVRMDEEGFLYFVGRRDHMIKSSGYRISPMEVEEALHASGEIREAAVVGVPDDVLGEAVKAFVVPRDGRSLDPAALLAFCSGRLPRYMVPRDIEVRNALPRTVSGKIHYAELRRSRRLIA